MPPKDSKSSKKTIEKEKKKIIEDKTFGLKNKNKSKKVEKYVKSVTQQVQNKGLDRRAEELAKQRKEEKLKAEQAKREMEALFKPVVNQPKAPPGVDPKSILCELFRIGQCTKGSKCKYAHDLAVERKTEKIDLYTDRRTLNEKEDGITNWDDNKLLEVVSTKQSESNRNLKTKIVCKYFLDAVEKKSYGWFWECPNGGDKCQYVHALPPGYSLKQKVEVVEEDEPTPIEELIEIERKKIVNGTPVTRENFLKWKEEKKRKKEKAKKEAEDKRLADIKAGRTVMSGREMFVFNPDMFVDDDAALDIDDKELGENTPEGEENEEQNAEENAEGEYLGNDEDEDQAENTTTTTTTTSEGDELAVEVNQSLFINEDDVPDIPED